MKKGGNHDMNENGTTTGNGGNLMENEHVKELFGILKDNGKDTSGLSTLINHVKDMEDFVKNAENKIAAMKTQLDTMKEVQNHPIKTALQNTIKALETKIAEIKEQLSELKNNIIEGCKNAVKAFKEKGISALNKIASFFRVKKGLQAIKNNAIKSVDNCDKSIAKIEAFAKEYHTAGRHIKNMARVMVGKKPIDTVKESGKLVKVFSAPYKAHKAALNGLKKSVDKAIGKLEQIDQKMEARQAAKTAAKKPTLMERLDAKKKEIKEREIETPKIDRAKSKGLEV